MPRPITAVIHNEALQHNLSIAKQHMPNSKVFAVVKANAYGHGIEHVYPSFQTADGFALLDIAEARRLRTLGWAGPILLLEGIFSAQDLQDCLDLNLSFTIHSEHQLNWVEQFSRAAHFDVYLKMNSGMNRLGFHPEHYQAAWERLNQLDQIQTITHMMHFSDADNQRFGESGIDYQYTIFEETIRDLPGESTICNSAAILRHPELHSDTVRSGIMLYGSSPDYPIHTAQDWDLQPTMSLRSEIIAIQELKNHDSVGYGSTFIAEHAMKIGIVACGYADGYPRVSPTGTPVLVNSIRSKIIGRISMDMLAVDISHVKDAVVGSEVVLWGKSSNGTILPIDEVAASSGTIGYELMCAVTARVNFINQE
ncbi:alanine racemase [Acinetobacter sp. ANC 4648]|uniref:alanine racemase n=1 Tax=Acinetobacter sp. ANC 4648 TaxID=1977875 RepID=UPI000A344397|nr:alanine racemase [Acinetobacter sp. ANC 4648]OTG79798.1 alanine racemase [Acinetobacter sp. ANC 4648]